MMRSARSFHLESLYAEADQDYDLRILYGNSSAFNERDLPKLAKRIDLVLAVPLLSVSFDQKRAYLAEYRIPIIDFDGQNYGRGERSLVFLVGRKRLASADECQPILVFCIAGKNIEDDFFAHDAFGNGQFL